jgi:hypothetical protein
MIELGAEFGILERPPEVLYGLPHCVAQERATTSDTTMHFAANGLKIARDTIVDAVVARRRSSMHHPRPRMLTRRAIPRCIGQGRQTSGIFGM